MAQPYCGSTGPKQCRLAIIGEAPGRQELIDGVPFVGASGNLLWTLLRSNGITRDECYCTNVIKTSSSPSPLASMSPSELGIWRNVLRAELANIQTNLYLTLGATAVWAVCDDRQVTNLRGSVIRAWNDHKTFVSLHPAAILYSPENCHVLEHDIRRAVIESLTPTISEGDENDDYTLFPSAMDCLNHIEAARQSGRFAFDIETPGGIISCLSITYHSNGQIVSCCVPMHGITYWSTDDYVIVLRALQAIFSDRSVLKIGQNVSYDIIGLQACGIRVAPPFEDIMHMHHAIDPLSPHSLAFQASMFTERPFWKDWDVAPNIPLAGKLEEHFIYNCQDGAATLQLREIYAKHPSNKFYNSRYRDVLPHLIQMYEDGLCQDTLAAKRIASELRLTASWLEQMIADGLGLPPLSVNSPKQVMHALYDVLHLPIQYNRTRKAGKLIKTPTADDEALVDLFLLTQDHLILAMRDAKEQYKLASFLFPSSKPAQRKRATWDQRIRCEYSMNTKTGRLSSHASIATKHGINLQQIPAFLRQVYIPEPGKIFLEPDYSQAEARVIAWDSLDYDMMHLFELARLDPKTYDIHWHNAELILEKPRSELSYADRNCCKHVVYGSFYAMQAEKLQKTVLKYTDPPVYLSLAECQRRQDVFKSKVPKFQERQDRIRNEVLSTGRQVSPTGRVVIYHDVVSERLKYCFGRRDYNETLRSAFAMVPQDVVAMLINRSLVAIDNELRARQIGRVALQVHDSLLLEINDDWPSVEQAFTLAKQVMETEFIIKGESMIVPAEFKLGHHWPCGQKGCALEAKDIRFVDHLRSAYEKIHLGR